MGPSCGGLTCNFAPFRLLPTIHDTRSAKPCPNSGVSIPAATFSVGVGAASATAVVFTLNWAAPAAALPDVSNSGESPLPPDARGPALPKSASASTAGALAAAFAAAAAPGAETAGADTGAPFERPAPRATPPMAGAVNASIGDDGESAAPAKLASIGAAPVAAAAMADAVTASAVASVLAEAPTFVAGAALPSLLDGPEVAALK